MSDTALRADEGRTPSAYDRETQIFPKLTEDQLQRAAAFGRAEDLAEGTVVFATGDRTVDFLIVLSGNVEIYDTDPDGRPNVFTVHGPSQFTGELDLFSNRKILVSGRMGAAGRVLRFDRDAFRKLLTGEPDIGEVIIRAFILRRMGLIEQTQGAVTVIGSRKDRRLIAIERFLRRNGHPLNLLDLDTDPAAAEALEAQGRRAHPLVVCANGTVLEQPTTFQVASSLGILEEIDQDTPYDVAVIGAGPAGLAASVYAASEGLTAIVIEAEAPGGQAGTSSKIENYLGFPTGISGQALAGRAQVQAQRFGAVIAVPRRVARIDCDIRPYRIVLEDGATVQARTIVIASGATYRKLDLELYDLFEGTGIHYAATALEASLCKDENVIVVGGGNSAGQAAVFLSRHARHVHMLVRGPGLADSMSSYLINRIDASRRIDLHTSTSICRLHGDARLERVSWRHGDGAERTHDVRNIFVMVGARPNSDFLQGCVALDDRGFVLTGADVRGDWPLTRQPHLFETSRPGIFAVGDIRASSVKRVASAVGEGSIAVQFLHKILAEDGA